MKLICMACSATKTGAPGMVPAIDRYDGPMWRTLRANLREAKEQPKIWFLSARYGFQLATLPIPDYEQLLTGRPDTMGNDDGFARSVAAADDVLFAGGKRYRDLMMEVCAFRDVTWTVGGIGMQRATLRRPAGR